MKAKKSLGQNFFVNKNLGDQIIDHIETKDTVVEIGPGQGFFTERLIHKFKNVIVIEKDNDLADQLKTLYPSITVFKEDFLSFDLSELGTKDITFFGSLPYNVSKPIIRKIIESEYFTNPAYFIVQKEVAEKYIYKDPYNILSLNTAIYSEVRKVLDIKPDSFRPRPKVNSSLISVKPKEIYIQDIKSLKNIIAFSFRQPRKNLKNNLKKTAFESKLPEEYFEKRASQLSLEEYINILAK